jgi:hypothetical protein
MTFAEMGEPFEFRDMRNCFSTWLAIAGVAEELRDRLMGRAARSVGRRHYMAPDLGRLREAIEAIRLDLKDPTGQGSGPPDKEKLSGELSQVGEDRSAERRNPIENQEAGRGSQMVRQRFAKPSYVGSNPIHASAAAGLPLGVAGF